MITSNDREYKLIKLIKQGKSTIDNDFKPLAHWIDNEYNVQTMNILYDIIDTYEKNVPRLEIIFEFENDREKFRNDPQNHFNYNPEKQTAIANQFKKLVSNVILPKKKGLLSFLRRNRSKYKTPGLFVVFSVFKPIAIEEVYSNVSREQIRGLKKQIGNKEIWEIISGFSSAVFFFFTDAQVEENKRNGVQEELAARYFDLLKPYDEFNYIKKECFSISLDRKENFDNNYQSNWYYYFK